MSFLNPAALYYLFPLIGTVLFFYLLKGRQREIVVSSILFWRKILRNLSSQRLRWRLPPELLLFLQLAILTLLILALAHPLLKRKGRQEEYLVLVLDSSASMQATDLTPDRFSVAKKMAQEKIKDFPANTKIALIQAHDQPHLVANFSHNRSYLLRELKGLTTLDVVGDEGKALSLASSLFPSQSKGRIIFFTDGAFEEDLNSLDRKVELVSLASQNPRNLGIISLEVRPTATALGEYQVLVRIRNFSSRKEQLSFKIWAEEKMLYEKEVFLLSGEEKGFLYSLKVDKKTVLKAEIDPHPQDDLRVDNLAYAVFGPGEGLKVLLVSRGNLFLEAALTSYPQVKLYRKEKAFAEEISGYDLVIFDGVIPPPLNKGNVVCIGVLPSNFFPEESWQINPVVTDWQSDHSLLRFVNLEEINVVQSLEVPPFPQARVLLNSSGQPLMQILEKEGLRLLFIAFNFYHSDFPLQVGFPIFIFNLLQWFHPHVFNPHYHQIQTGENFTLTREGQEEITIVDPRNRVIKIKPMDPPFFSQTRTAGLYRINGKRFFAANLLNGKESNIFPRVKISPLAEEDRAHPPRLSKLSLFPYLILMACGLLLLEWYLYHKPGLTKRKIKEV